MSLETVNSIQDEIVSQSIIFPFNKRKKKKTLTLTQLNGFLNANSLTDFRLVSEKGTALRQHESRY